MTACETALSQPKKKKKDKKRKADDDGEAEEDAGEKKKKKARRKGSLAALCLAFRPLAAPGACGGCGC